MHALNEYPFINQKMTKRTLGSHHFWRCSSGRWHLGVFPSVYWECRPRPRVDQEGRAIDAIYSQVKSRPTCQFHGARLESWVHPFLYVGGICLLPPQTPTSAPQHRICCVLKSRTRNDWRITSVASTGISSVCRLSFFWLWQLRRVRRLIGRESVKWSAQRRSVGYRRPGRTAILPPQKSWDAHAPLQS